MNNRILIVDDEPANLKILRIRLQDDYEMFEANSGERALELAEEVNPALVLLDIMMDGIDGYEVTERLKSNKKLDTTKVILISGKAMVEEKLKGYYAGADDYITKPFNGLELKAKVSSFMKAYHLEESLRDLNINLEKEVAHRTEILMQKERIAAIGQNSAQIVHNLNNPLAVITGCVRILRKKHPELRQLEIMHDATIRLNQTVKDILTSVRGDGHEKSRFNLLEVINSELNLVKLNSLSKLGVTLEVECPSETELDFNVIQFKQILGNLLTNALHATVNQDEKSIKVSVLDQSGRIEVCVTDSGCGMSEETLSKVFEPLFTTKVNENDHNIIGSGLGMSYCRKVMQDEGGDILVTSVPDVGTKVVLVFLQENKVSNRQQISA